MGKKNKATIDGLGIQNRDIYVSLGNNEDQTERLIRIGAHYTLPTKKLLGIFTRPNTGKFTAKIEVSDTDDLTFHKHQKPLKCLFLGKDPSDECEIELKKESREISFHITFDPQSIKDCNNKTLNEGQRFKLQFVFSISSNSDKKDIKKVQDYLIIHLNKFESKPIVSFTPNEEVVKDGKIKYQEITDQTCIGTITIKHNAKFTAAPILKSCNIKFQLMDRDNNNCLFDIKDGKHINSSISISINPLKPNEEKKYPVFLEKKNTYNPLRDSEITLHYTYNKTTKELKPSITVLRDNTITEGSVLLNVPGQKPLELYQKYDEKAIILKHILHNDTRFNDNIIHIVFQNLATESSNSKAGVYIWGITLDKKITEGEERLKLTNEHSFNDFVTIEKPTEKEIHRLAGNKNRLDYQITFKKELLKATLPAPDKNETYVEINFTLEYYILVDRDGNYFSTYNKYEKNVKNEEIYNETITYLIKQCDGQKKKAEFTIKLQKECSSAIYCVDFGTSAVTAGSFSFSNREYHFNSIDLLGQKQQLIKNNDSTAKEFDTEPGPFINSRICFNKSYFDPKSGNKPTYNYISKAIDPKDMAKDYFTYPVHFSPAPNRLDPDYELPNLKTMIGHKNIPIAIGDSAWTYKDKTGNTQNVFNDNGKTNCPLFETTELFKICYRQLFTHFIYHPQQGRGGTGNEQINRLVVTVPNTYTPKNIQNVKEIIRETIPTVYPEHLCFISESDAVACYYIDKKKLNDEGKETVLIYDMGAGTLDLTLLERDRQGDRENVNIIKKIGINIAGNYLDYTILRILADLLKWEGEASDVLDANVLLNLNQTKEKHHDSAQAKTRDGLKNLIKELKTRLNDCTPANEESQTQKESPVDNVSQTHPNNDTDKESQTQKEDQYIKKVRDAVKKINLNDILTHTFFKDEFLKYVTTDVFKNFFRNGETFDIDVVVFSGRSTSLNAIRNAVQENIQVYCSNSPKVKYANISDEGINIVSKVNDIKTGSNILKNIVAKGACVYMNHYFENNGLNKFNSHANYASFGIITHGRNEQLRYYPIIQKCADYDKTNDTIEGIINIPIQVENIAHINLVQSYSENTGKDYQNDELGLISTIMTVPTDNLTPFIDGEKRGKCTFKLVLNNQIKNPDKSVLEFYIVDENGTIQADVEPQEDFESSTLRKSLWPVIFR